MTVHMTVYANLFLLYDLFINDLLKASLSKKSS